MTDRVIRSRPLDEDLRSISPSRGRENRKTGIPGALFGRPDLNNPTHCRGWYSLLSPSRVQGVFEPCLPAAFAIELGERLLQLIELLAGLAMLALGGQPLIVRKQLEGLFGQSLDLR
jgi:hypothetical protein